MKSSKPHPGGRPSKYKPIYADDIVNFFTRPAFQKLVKSEKTTIKSNGTKEIHQEFMYVSNDLPTYEAYARKIGVDDDTLQNWTKDEKKYPGFFGAYNKCKSIQREFLASIGLKGFAPPASFIFVTKNVTDWKDKTQTEHSGNLTWSEQPPK